MIQSVSLMRNVNHAPSTAAWYEVLFGLRHDEPFYTDARLNCMVRLTSTMIIRFVSEKGSGPFDETMWLTFRVDFDPVRRANEFGIRYRDPSYDQGSTRIYVDDPDGNVLLLSYIDPQYV